MAAGVQFLAFSNYSWTYAINLSPLNLENLVFLRASSCRAHFRASLRLLVQLRPTSSTPKSKESCDHDQIHWIHRLKLGYPRGTGNRRSQVGVVFAPVPDNLYCGQVSLVRARLTAAERAHVSGYLPSIDSGSSCYSNCIRFIRLQVFTELVPYSSRVQVNTPQKGRRLVQGFSW